MSDITVFLYFSDCPFSVGVNDRFFSVLPSLTIEVPTGTLFLDALEQQGILVHTPCGGSGRCGACRVFQFFPDSAPKNAVVFPEFEQKACQFHLMESGYFRIPSTALAGTLESMQILTSVSERFACPSSSCQRISLELSPPTREESCPDLQRLESKLRNKNIPVPASQNWPLQLIRQLGEKIRSCCWKFDLLLCFGLPVDLIPTRTRWTKISPVKDHSKNENSVNSILDNFSPPHSILSIDSVDLNSVDSNSSDSNSTDFNSTDFNSTNLDSIDYQNQSEFFAAAVDLGTTTIAVELLDPFSGKVLGIQSCRNPQTSTGGDVISRINKIMQDKNVLQKLQKQVLASVDLLTERLCSFAQIKKEQIIAVSVAGNTVMQQIFCGISPESLGVSPFVPTLQNYPVFRASEFGFGWHPEAVLAVFPVFGGFVGGDIVAGVLSSRIQQADDPALLLDIGTNGEIVLVHQDKIMTSATAAGPAFEGAGIAFGMMGIPGAVEKVRFDPVQKDIFLSVIGSKQEFRVFSSPLQNLETKSLNLPVFDSQKSNLQKAKTQKNEAQRDELQRNELQRNESLRNDAQRSESQKNELSGVVDTRLFPKGICGSGLVDLLAELLRFGLLTRNGQLLSSDEFLKQHQKKSSFSPVDEKKSHNDLGENFNEKSEEKNPSKNDDWIMQLSRRLVIHQGKKAFLIFGNPDMTADKSNAFDSSTTSNLTDVKTPASSAEASSSSGSAGLINSASPSSSSGSAGLTNSASTSSLSGSAGLTNSASPLSSSDSANLTNSVSPLSLSGSVGLTNSASPSSSSGSADWTNSVSSSSLSSSADLTNSVSPSSLSSSAGLTNSVSPSSLSSSADLTGLSEISDSGGLTIGSPIRSQNCNCPAIYLTQADIRQVQLAVGAIRAGIRTLVQRNGLALSDLKNVFVAGGFGNFLNAENARRIGLFPPEISVDAVHYCGNTSLQGAVDVLCSASDWENAQKIADQAVHCDLSTVPEFQEAFMDSMFFPE